MAAKLDHEVVRMKKKDNRLGSTKHRVNDHDGCGTGNSEPHGTVSSAILRVAWRSYILLTFE